MTAAYAAFGGLRPASFGDTALECYALVSRTTGTRLARCWRRHGLYVVEILGRSEAQTTVCGEKSPELRGEDALDIGHVTHASLKNEEIASASTFPCTMSSVRCPPDRSTNELPGIFWSSAASLAGTIRSRLARMISVLAFT